MTAAPSLLALDWGTSTLRACLLGAGGAVVERRTEPWGVMHLPDGGFAAAFERTTGGWRARWPALPVIAAGMVGSSQGWVQVPYRPCPVGVDDLAAALVPVEGGALHVVPGVMQLDERPDVMRGEETQVVGALDLHPRLAERALLVLPGTHAKWVRVADGRLDAFATYMTGELFAVLRDHSILGRAARATSAADPAAADAAFARGVLAARDAASGVAPLLFGARALPLLGWLAPEAGLDYLSGLLIGDELRCGLADGAERLALVGDGALCRRYAAALRLFGLEDVPVIEGAAEQGLWCIARRAGLVTTPHTPVVA